MSDASSSAERSSWNPFAGLSLVIGLYFLAPVIASIALGGAAALIGRQLTESVTTQFLYIVIVEALTVGAVIAFLKHNNSGVAALGLIKPRIKDLFIGIGVYPLYLVGFAVTVIIATRFIPALNINQEQELGFDNVTGTLPLIVTFISLVILPPIVEELTVRGLIFTSLRKKLGLAAATMLTSFVFAIAHLPAGGAAGPLYIAAIDTFILSLMLCVVREKTGSLWPCITLHALKNGIAFVSLYILAVG